MKNKKNDILLSIVIPVFNRQESLSALLVTLTTAILEKELEDKIEIIVIDDASIPPIKVSNINSEIVLARNQSNSGAPFSRNRGLKLSIGQFVHFHDSDDSVSATWLSEVMDKLMSRPSIDLFVTGRIDHEKAGDTHRYPKFFHKHYRSSRYILSRLIYWNCIGPMGGVTFSRRVLEQISIRDMASCQDWQMYIDAIKHAKVLVSRPDIKFIFNKTGDDRISYNARKKILGHLQLSRQTRQDSLFGKKIRLFYLYACKQHIFNKGGLILSFYKKNRIVIVMTFLIIAAYSFLPKFWLKSKNT